MKLRQLLPSELTLTDMMTTNALNNVPPLSVILEVKATADSDAVFARKPLSTLVTSSTETDYKKLKTEQPTNGQTAARKLSPLLSVDWEAKLHNNHVLQQ